MTVADSHMNELPANEVKWLQLITVNVLKATKWSIRLELLMLWFVARDLFYPERDLC